MDDKEQIEKDMAGSSEKLEEAKAGIASLREELTTLDEHLAKNEVGIPLLSYESLIIRWTFSLQALHATAERKLQEERATLTRFDNELKELERVIKDKKQAVANADLELTKLQHDVQVLTKEATTVSNFVTNLEKQYEWITEEKESVICSLSIMMSGQWPLVSLRMFGKPGSPYDFAALDVGRLKERARELEETQKGMKKKVNPKVINMIDRYVLRHANADIVSWRDSSVEKKETALKKMLATVMKDKEKIEETIEELDRYKRDALQKTWEKVDGWGSHAASWQR
jgi:structural maintenance of chromosome 2